MTNCKFNHILRFSILQVPHFVLIFLTRHSVQLIPTICSHFSKTPGISCFNCSRYHSFKTFSLWAGVPSLQTSNINFLQSSYCLNTAQLVCNIFPKGQHYHSPTLSCFLHTQDIFSKFFVHIRSYLSI